MFYKFLLFLTFLYSIFALACSVEKPYPYGIFYNETTFILSFLKGYSYYTRFILYQNDTTPRTEMAPNYFDCSNVGDLYRYCFFHSDDPFSRLWGGTWSKACGREETDPTEDCTFNIGTRRFPLPYNLKYSRLPPTSGGDIVINGTYLRLVSGPNYLYNTLTGYFIVKGNFSDPSFNCNSITVTITPGSGNFILIFDETGRAKVPFSYAAPTISSIAFDPSKQIITVNGDNFYTDNSLVQVYFDGIRQQSINITKNHKQIQVNNFNRVDIGPMFINITVNQISIEKNYTHCFSAIITSISSVSNDLGGIVTIKGSKLSSTLNSSLIPTITIGNKQCKFIKSSTTELECKLDPNESGGKKLSVDVNFNGCNSTSSGGSAVTFTYNIPTLSSGSYSNGIVTLNGKNLVKNKESFIQIYPNEIGDHINIENFNISSNEKILTFKLPHLRCKSFFITFTTDDISSNTLSISASLLTNVINEPSVSNGTLYIELYYIECPIGSSSTLTVTVGNSLTNQCLIPSLQSSTSDYYHTTCSVPYGTGINNRFIFKYNSYEVDDKFSYSPPIVESRSFSIDKTIITINGNNFGNSKSLIQVYFNGNDVSSKIQSLNNNQFTFKALTWYDSGPINISVDGIKMESSFYLTLPPIINDIINKDKTLSCGSFITVSGKNLLTSDEEFKVKVLENNQDTIIIKQDEYILIVKSQSSDSPLNVSVFIGNDLIISNVLLTYLEPIITVIPTIKNNKDGISIIIGGISLSNIINASLTLSSNDDITYSTFIPLKCNLKCNLSSNNSFYYNNSKLSSNENDITNNTDLLSCHSYSNLIANETSGVLNLQFPLKFYHFNVKIDYIESSMSSSLSSSLYSSLMILAIIII
ncbi:hypothetical protein ACTFIR_012157 [Dictyostelium discoideum]